MTIRWPSTSRTWTSGWRGGRADAATDSSRTVWTTEVSRDPDDAVRTAHAWVARFHVEHLVPVRRRGLRYPHPRRFMWISDRRAGRTKTSSETLAPCRLQRLQYLCIPVDDSKRAGLSTGERPLYTWGWVMHTQTGVIHRAVVDGPDVHQATDVFVARGWDVYS